MSMNVNKAWIRYTAGGLLALTGVTLAPLPARAELSEPNPVVSDAQICTNSGTGFTTAQVPGAADLLATQHPSGEVNTLLQDQFQQPAISENVHADDTEDSIYTDSESEEVLATFNEGVDGPMAATEKDLSEYTARYAGVDRKYPITTAVYRYAINKAMNVQFQINPEVLDGIQLVPKIGVAGAQVGGAVETTIAVTARLKALALADKALAAKNAALTLGTQARQLSAAAQAAAQAGNMQQAASLSAQAKAVGAQAQALGSKAKATGAKAMKAGNHARNAAKVGKILAIVGGSLAIIDGGFDLYRGITGLADVNELDGVARAALEGTRGKEEISQEDAENDFASVMQEIGRLRSESKEKVGIGSTKVGCGGLMIGSAFMSGPLAPVVAGAVGAGCLIGTAIYEYREPIGNFLKSLKDMFTFNLVVNIPLNPGQPIGNFLKKIFTSVPSGASIGVSEQPQASENSSEGTQVP